jgi:hypothetical protein
MGETLGALQLFFAFAEGLLCRLEGGDVDARTPAM